MVEEELKQGQVVRAEVPTEGEVVPQPTVEILDQGAGANGMVGHFADGLVDIVEAVMESLWELGLTTPATRVGVAEVLQTQQFAERVDGDLESGGEFGEVAVEFLSEAEQLIAMVVEKGAERVEAVRAERGAVAQ